MNKLDQIREDQKREVKFWLVVTAIVGFLSISYLWSNTSEYLDIKAAIENSENLKANINEALTDQKNIFEENRAEAEAFYSEVYDKLSLILPESENVTALTRQIDNFEKQLAKRHNPFEVSNISFQEASQTEQFSILPFRMNIRSSESNFQKFLSLIENSGTLNEGVRLMEISSIRLNFLNGEEDLINFSVQINAYFQK